MIKAHAQVYHLYDEEFRADQQGELHKLSSENIVFDCYS
jgi:hypothetical protein